jgi:hypothetical protein
MAAKQSPKVFLIRRSPNKLTQYERQAIVSHFNSVEPELVRIELTDWKSHLDLCKEQVKRGRDIVFIPSTADHEALKATTLWAVNAGFTHAFFGKGLELRKLTGVEITSEPL